MRTTLELDDDVVAAAKELAAIERRSLGSVVSELARRGLTPAKVDVKGELPVIRVPANTPPITPEMVRRGLEEDYLPGAGPRQCAGRAGVGLPRAPCAYARMVHHLWTSGMGHLSGHRERLRARVIEPQGAAQP